MNKLDKLIQTIRYLKEEGEGASTGSIPNVVGTGEKSLGYNIYTLTPRVFSRKNKKVYAKG